uniref:50S ribosomal protein L27 n=1 Tax=Hyaloperonospora arabidopsidis (strain Emoy2) TaxID=559515 RepID=M4BCM6_HYAAE
MAMCTARVFGCSVSATARAGLKNESVFSIPCRLASKKAGGSTKNGRDSESKRLGVKKFGGQSVVAGNIIIRQRGTKYHVGTGVGIGKDHTIFATRDGFVRFWYNTPKKHQEVSVKSHREVQRAGVQSSS